MSITIRLDASALATLVEADSGFKFELQRAVVAEVARKLLFKDLGDELKVIKTGLVAELVTALRDDSTLSAKLDKALEDAISEYKYANRGWGHGQRELKPELKQLLVKEVGEIIQNTARSEMGGVEEKWRAEVEKRTQWIMDGVSKYIDQRINQGVAAAINKGVADRIAAIQTAISTPEAAGAA